MGRSSVAVALVFFAGSVLTAQPASAPWRTIETAHFRVHFPAPFEAWAARTASAIEAIHERVTDFVGYRPPKPIDVVIEDPAADANGIAYPFLDRPVIVLWTSPPEAESGLGDYDEWINLVTTHEMAHIVHLTRPRNRPGLLSGCSRCRSARCCSTRRGGSSRGTRPSSRARSPARGGRARATARWCCARFAIEGKLPSYGALSSTSGWLGGSMAYLVGSAYLEWLEEREGRARSRSSGSGWPRGAAGASGRPFERSSVGRRRTSTTGSAPRSRRARSKQEKAPRAAGLSEGELWQRLEGGTVSPQVSPDGSQILARRDPTRAESYLAVWTTEESEEERGAGQRRRSGRQRLLEDANEVPEKVVTPRRREPKWRLPRANGFSAQNPRWMPDGKRVLFSRRAPDAARRAPLGPLPLGDRDRKRLSRDPRGGHRERRPRAGRDLGRGSAQPTRRHGSRARGPASGTVKPISETPPDPRSLARLDPSTRLPDGRTVAALLHREGRWRLVLVSRDEIREVADAGVPVGPPAWSPTDRGSSSRPMPRDLEHCSVDPKASDAGTRR